MVERSKIFWQGLILFGLSLTVLFNSFWYPFADLSIFRSYFGYYGYTWKYIAPWIFGGFVFLWIGWYMMKSGTEPKKAEVTPSPKQQ